MTSYIVIPARLHSTRLPEKLLLAETGKPLIQHTYESAQKATQPSGIIVATDHERIAEAVKGFGGSVAMTDPAAPSGTDRVAEVAHVPVQLGHSIEHGVELLGPPFCDPDSAPELTVDSLVVD